MMEIAGGIAALALEAHAKNQRLACPPIAKAAAWPPEGFHREQVASKGGTDAPLDFDTYLRMPSLAMSAR